MKRYILNSPIITSPGVYEYILITTEAAWNWLKKGRFITYFDDAEALEIANILFRTQFEVDSSEREILQIRMQEGDEALVFRRLCSRGLITSLRNVITPDFVKKYFEIGILTKKSEL